MKKKLTLGLLLFLFSFSLISAYGNTRCGFVDSVNHIPFEEPEVVHVQKNLERSCLSCSVTKKVDYWITHYEQEVEFEQKYFTKTCLTCKMPKLSYIGEHYSSTSEAKFVHSENVKKCVTCEMGVRLVI